MKRVLIAGAGYLAAHTARALRDAGHLPTLSSRRPPATPEAADLAWLPADMRDAGSVRGLIHDARPDAVIVVHGPSDITWCEANAREAEAAHADGARYLAGAVHSLPVLLISSDNVFPGRQETYGESDPAEPANAYGRAKLSAEHTLLTMGTTLVLRVSLVYGWDSTGLRPNFFTTCTDRLRAGQPVTVPADHWNTPVHVTDVAAWCRELIFGGHTGLLHLGGPRRLSREEWARLIAGHVGADPGLVRPASLAETGYACRPRNACLHSERAADLAELAGLEPRDVTEVTRLLLEGDTQ